MSQGEKKARDLALPVDQCPKIKIGASLSEAIGVMSQAGVAHFAIVVDRVDRPIGLLPLRAVFEALEPRFARVKNLPGFFGGDWSVPLFWDGLFTERCEKAPEIRIEEVVIPIRTAAVQGGDTLIQVLYALRQTKLECLAVLDGENLIGVVDSAGLFKEIARQVAGGGQ